MSNYHLYSDKEISKEYGKPDESPVGLNDYLVFLETYAFGGFCGGQSKGILRYENKLHALKHLYKVYQEFANNFVNAEEIDEILHKINNRIEEIISNKSDENIIINDIGYETSNSGFFIRAEGYWDKVVPEVLYLINTDETYKEYIEEEIDNEEAGKFDEEEQYDSIEENEFDVDIFLDNKDIHSVEFIDYFIELCGEYDGIVN